MNQESYQHENSLMHAMRTGQWTKELRAHVSECSRCKETEMASRFMNSVAQSFNRDNAFPDPGRIWLKSRVVNQDQLEERAMSPIILAQAAVKYGLSAMLLFLIVQAWSVVEAAIHRGLNWIQTALLASSMEGPLGYITMPAFALMLLVLLSLFLQPRLRQLIGI
jgi:hypothetical protein